MLFITPRERDVLQLLADRTARPTIADRLGLSDRELDTSLLPALFTRLDVTCEADALAAAARRGLLASNDSTLLIADLSRSTSVLAGL